MYIAQIDLNQHNLLSKLNSRDYARHVQHPLGCSLTQQKTIPTKKNVSTQTRDSKNIWNNNCHELVLTSAMSLLQSPLPISTPILPVHKLPVPPRTAIYKVKNSVSTDTVTNHTLYTFNICLVISQMWIHKCTTVEPLYKDTPEMQTPRLIRTLSVVPAT